ncbi:hypothetical protein BGLT_06316 [Caballeronia glathei]|nr:hypothetical protein BGLT_06316 [Caballeronia glathei]
MRQPRSICRSFISYESARRPCRNGEGRRMADSANIRSRPGVRRARRDRTGTPPDEGERETNDEACNFCERIRRHPCGNRRCARKRPACGGAQRQRDHDRVVLGDRAAHRRVRAGGQRAGRLRRRARREARNRSDTAIRPWIRPGESCQHAGVLSPMAARADFPDSVWKIASRRERRECPDGVWKIGVGDACRRARPHGARGALCAALVGLRPAAFREKRRRAAFTKAKRCAKAGRSVSSTAR